MKQKLLEIIRHYGYRHQLKKLNEEVFELIEAIRDYNTVFKNVSKEHVEEEFADVMVLLMQLEYYFELNDRNIAEIMQQKINRQLERMKEESEEK